MRRQPRWTDWRLGAAYSLAGIAFGGFIVVAQVQAENGHRWTWWTYLAAGLMALWLLLGLVDWLRKRQLRRAGRWPEAARQLDLPPQNPNVGYLWTLLAHCWRRRPGRRSEPGHSS